MRRGAWVMMATAFAVGASAAEAKKRPTPSPAPSIVPTLSPPPLSSIERVARLQRQIEAFAGDPPGGKALGIAVVDLQYERHVALHGAAVFPLGDTATQVIAFVAYRLADQNRLKLDERVLVRRDSLRTTGPIAQLHPSGGITYPYWELLRLMLSNDDPTARALVLRRIGGSAVVQGVLNRLGLRSLQLDAAHPIGTADAVAALLKGIAENRFLLLDTTTEYLGTLGRRSGAEQARIVTFPDGRRVVAVTLFDPATSSAVREGTLAGVARDIDEAFR
ncbi:MAG: serine hydrolase [Candidatus Eremiobacteraeota bacterium]|nr:serine hydrolase [Candidatus Eremiobacteraeota bacterium]